MDTIGGLNLHAVCADNPVDLELDRYNILTTTELSPDPYYDPTNGYKKKPWSRFITILKWVIVAFIVFTAIIAIVFGDPAAKSFGIGLLTSAISGGISGAIMSVLIGGVISVVKGNNFFKGAIDNAISGFLDGFIVAALMFCASSAMATVNQSGSQLGKQSKGQINEVCGKTGNCFIAGTLVLTEHGHKAIEDIEVGDKVWSYDEETGDKQLKEVVQLIPNKTDSWVRVYINEEEITCTKEHPFYILNTDNDTELVNFEGRNNSEYKGQWVAAKNLKAEMKVLLSNNKNGTISSIEIEELNTPEDTYNFEVKDYHTYYVGNEGILVHNACPFDEIYNNPEKLIGKSGDEIGKILGDNFTRTGYGTKGDGWRFMDKYGNKIAYHAPGGKHETAYYILKKSNTATRLKLIGTGYNPLNEKRTIYHIFNGIIK